MPTKYTRQIARARAMITKAGTTCTWYKPVDSTDDDSLPPEFQGDTPEPTPYPGVPIVFYTENRLDLATRIAMKLTGSDADQIFGMIPGDVPFTPEIDDAVLINGETKIVAAVNTLQPDMTPIIHQMSFK